uniref:Uncharacterized protein n=1 Tax=Cyclopterus lumpus TaxID=8103 RepID=A0A8C2WK57_CYCLU
MHNYLEIIPQEAMQGSPENIPLGVCTLSQSRDQLTPPSRTESTVFSLSRSESEFWYAIHLMTTGGSFLACGIIISGLWFAGHCKNVTTILGPALLNAVEHEEAPELLQASVFNL